jgi:hypothetical protein
MESLSLLLLLALILGAAVALFLALLSQTAKLDVLLKSQAQLRAELDFHHEKVSKLSVRIPRGRPAKQPTEEPRGQVGLALAASQQKP